MPMKKASDLDTEKLSPQKRPGLFERPGRGRTRRSCRT
jgi:hypothetical protein